MSESDAFWANDPWVLVQSDALLEVVPSQAMPLAERYNALARLIIVIAVAAAILLRKAWPLAAGAVALLLDWLLYRWKERRLREYSPDLQLATQQQDLQSAYQQPQPPPQTPQFADTPQEAAARPPSTWEAFVRGPAENLVNGASCALDGTNPSHGDNYGQRTSPYELSGMPSTQQPMPVSGAQSDSVPDLEFSSVPGSFESKRLPKVPNGYMLDSGAPMDNAVFGPTSRPQAQPTVRPTTLMFQGRQQTLDTANQPTQWPSQWPEQLAVPQASYQYQGGQQAPSAQPAPSAQQQYAQQQFPQQPQSDSAQRRAVMASAPPVCKPWHLMNEAEQLNYLARQKRDAFIDRLFTDTSEGINNHQFQILSNFNEFQDREWAMDALYGKDSLGYSALKDKWTWAWEKYQK